MQAVISANVYRYTDGSMDVIKPDGTKQRWRLVEDRPEMLSSEQESTTTRLERIDALRRQINELLDDLASLAAQSVKDGAGE